MVERYNGLISDVLATTRFWSRDDLQTTIERYVKLFNNHLLQKALGHKTPLQAMRAWREDRPDLFVRRLNNQMGLDTRRGGGVLHQFDRGRWPQHFTFCKDY